MTNSRRKRAVAALSPMLLLGGCLGALVGGGQPDGLYRFGDARDMGAVQRDTVPRRSLLVMPIRFPASAAGDRLLTVAGNEAAYLKDVRWMSPAPILFRDALNATLRRRVPDLSLADRATAAGADTVLTIEVESFAASYDRGIAAPATIHIAGVASLVNSGSRTVVARKSFAQAITASADTVTAIVAAIDLACRNSTVELADWTNVHVPLRNRIAVVKGAVRPR